MVKVNQYYRAFVELNEIIKYFDDNLKKKIPANLMEAIISAGNTNKDDYKFIYDEVLPLWQQNILPETKALLSILYSDYLCSKEEKKKWDEYDKFENQLYNEESQKQSQKKYNPDELFKDKNSVSSNSNNIKNYQNSLDMVEVKEPKWYKKIFLKIWKIIFRK